MTLTIAPAPMRGEVPILPSKSQLHRMLICAALSEETCFLRCGKTDAEDVLATIACLEALGATINRRDEGFQVQPLRRDALPQHCRLPCGESGSTLRFLLPLICALGIRGEFHLAGRLPDRPLSPLDTQLMEHGCHIWREKPNVLCCEGQLTAGAYHLPGNVSSQYITGLLLALPLLPGDSSLQIEGTMESADYVALTLDILAQFGVSLLSADGLYRINGAQTMHAQKTLSAEGDWSNAAFWLCAGAMPGGKVLCHGLSADSRQGDRAVCGILEAFGATLNWKKTTLAVSEGLRKAVVIDASAIPDLIPALACVAAVSEGTTQIINAARLRLKESDRLASVAQTLNALGARVTEEAEGLCIVGVARLQGGRVDAWGDHRIAMMAAIAATACEAPVTISGAEAVRKSYPHFWQELATLGIPQKEEDT